MKKLILFGLLISAMSVSGQSLKDALYGGKLKTDSGTVIRKGEDLSTKIDTSTKKPVEVKAVPVVRDSSITGGLAEQIDSASAAGIAADNTTALTGDATKDNNKIWKDYITELTSALQTEVLPSKKLKDGTYSVLIEYEIGLDGAISVNSVSSSPENSFLEQQVKDRIILTAPQMAPLLNNYGKPRKAVKKHTLILTK